MNSYPNSTDIAREILSKIMIGMLLLFCAISLFANSNIASLAADATPTPSIPYFATPTPQPACPPNCEYLPTILLNGFVLKLNFPYQIEATLTSEQIKEQRIKIGTMQRELTSIIGGKSSTSDGLRGFTTIAYDAVPYIVFYGNAEAIELLKKHPYVAGIYVDSALNEVFSLELDSVPEITGEMLDAAYGSPLPALKIPSKKCFGFQADSSCAKTIENAHQRGSITLTVALNTSREYLFTQNAQFQSLENAAARQTAYKFMIAMRNHVYSMARFTPEYRSLNVSADAQAVEKILNLPMVSHITDWTDAPPVCSCDPVMPDQAD